MTGGYLRMAGLDDRLRDLVDGAYAAAIDESLWTPWLDRLTETLNGAAASFYVVDRASGALRSQLIRHPDPAILERYFDEHIHRLDPQIAVVAEIGESCLYRDTDHLNHDDPATAEYLAWQVSNGRLRHYMTAVMALDDRHAGGFSIHRSVADGATPRAEQAMLEAIFPHVHRAMQLGFSHAQKLTGAYWDGVTRGATDPALLLDGHGQVLRMTGAMAAMIETGDGLDVTAGRLRALHPADDAALDAAIARTLKGDGAGGWGTRSGRALRIARRSGRSGYVVTAYPLPRRMRMLAPAEAAALVMVVDPTATVAVSESLLRQAFALTPREAQLAALLSAGHSVESAAATMTIGLPTARIHLRRILEKTGTARQTELVRLLGRLG